VHYNVDFGAKLLQINSKRPNFLFIDIFKTSQAASVV
jgi:hypothetical protein